MSYMISASSSYHWVRRISAETNTEGVLKIILHGDDGVSDIQFNSAEIMIFTGDKQLVDRLVIAINNAAIPPNKEKAS